MKADLAAGLISIATGIVMGWFSSRYPVGTLSAMGAGYFPLLLSALLVLLGLPLVFAGLQQARVPLSLPPLRGVILILGAPIAFAVLVERVGLLPALVAVTLCGVAAQKEGTPVEKALTSLGIVAIAAVIFIGALRLPIPWFQWDMK